MQPTTPRTKTDQSPSTGLKISRYFTKKGIHPYDEVVWQKTDAIIPGKDKPAYEQKGVEFPDFYSVNAINIIASKYFRGHGIKKETSLRQIISRVAKTFRKWGEEQKYFKNKLEADIFEDELTSIILHQRAWFNSPVWFNVGVNENPQCSACFILSVRDSMESILDWIKTEGIIFKNGSGSGINLSNLRAKGEPLSIGGSSSGPISFMRGADAVAGSIKSGGATRRAAKMVLLNADHPDILEFIRVKADEELKVRAFIEAGYDLTDMNHPMWQNIFFQNANNSIRIGDDFMQAVLRDKEWHTKYRKTGEIAQTYKAKDLLWEAAKAAWECGDPGVQFDDTIQKWHTCKSSGKINATNPCAEYVFLDNTSCNLASINLMKYLKDDGSFDVKGFKHTAQVTFMAQDILIDRAGYPIESIGEETKKYRTIGLGYANLGSLLMALGIPYDSDEGRTWAASISALMLGEAYKTSSLLAEKNGVFSEYEKNKESALNVMKMHREKAYEINDAHAPKTILEEARHLWDEVVDITPVHGLRNAQAVVIAPTGTIGLAMDCDTTGIEPDFSLVKMKQLVGGGFMLFVNKTVPNALKRMGYSQEEIDDIIAHLERTKNIETAPHIKEEHIPVFDTAVKPADGTRSIHWMGHVKMVAAVQPFVSGAISKTFNMPSDATIQDIYDAYYESWKLGIKCLAVYRDNSKATQALFGAAKKDKTKKPQRRKLPDIRQSETHKFSIAGHEGYLTYSFFEDGTLGEIFIKMSKQGSTLAGLLDAFAIAISIALQYGVPLKDLVRKLSMMRFDPMGITNNSEIRFANSIIDYIFKYLAARFLQHGDLVSLGLAKHDVALQNQPKLFEAQVATARDEHIGSMGQPELSGPPCKGCGGMTIRTGSCYTCTECGESTGGCS